jgi:hypothetical protein
MAGSLEILAGPPPAIMRFAARRSARRYRRELTATGS